jgi:NAD(P)-dependent dehydrogenase (short-subunit alcohol dehydrogenase family)
VITGGDSGIGRAVAILFAMEGAKVAIAYLPDEKTDAFHTKEQVEKNGGQINLYPTDIQTSENCRLLVEQIVTDFGGVDILVNNAGYQLEQCQLSDISEYAPYPFR